MCSRKITTKKNKRWCFTGGHYIRNEMKYNSKQNIKDVIRYLKEKNMRLISTLSLLVALMIVLGIKIILIIAEKIRQHFIHKQCNYLCFACKYRYECNEFLRGC